MYRYVDPTDKIFLENGKVRKLNQLQEIQKLALNQTKNSKKIEVEYDYVYDHALLNTTLSRILRLLKMLTIFNKYSFLQ